MENWIRIGDHLINLTYATSITFTQAHTGLEAKITFSSGQGEHSITFTGQDADSLRQFGKSEVKRGYGRPSSSALSHRPGPPRLNASASLRAVDTVEAVG